MKKKVLFVLLLVLGLAGSALALGPLGPPTASLKQGQWGVAAEYAFSDSDVEVEGVTLEGLESNVFLGQIGYGISDVWELYGLAGAADHDSDNLEPLSFGYDFAYGFGTKYTLIKDETLSWGVLFEMGWKQGDDDASVDLTDWGYGADEDVDVELDYYEIFIAIGPTWKMSDCLSLYGGPFFYMLDGDVDADLVSESISLDMEEESSFGGYVGLQWDMSPNTCLYGEFQFTGDMTVYGGGFGWKF